MAEKSPRKPRILVAPLDWGLGHATRCIPVIYELMAQNADVWLAAEGSGAALLAGEFPHLPLLPLEGYRINYGRSGAGLIRRLLLQLPRMSRSIKKENRWLRDAIAEHQFDAVISDNRFGLYNRSIPCVFITHQLAIRSPFGKASFSLLQKMNYRFIDRFAACWIADDESNGLAGELSHPPKKPAIPCQYIGILSRLEKTGLPEKKGHLFISLSGPEPQRTIFENKLIDEISHYNGTATIVRGLPDHASLIPSTNDIRFYNHLPAKEYNSEMEQAEYVISRSGYSTIMDLVTLQKRPILIPTPGQTEQEYLALHLEKSGIACCCDQQNFSLNKMLEKARSFNYQLPSAKPNYELSSIVSGFLGSFAKNDT